MNTQNQKVVLSKLLPVLFGFYVMGFVDIVGAATKYVKDDFHLSGTIANILPFMVFVWFFIMSIPTGIIQDKIGRRKASCIGIALTGIGMFIPFIYYSFPSVLAGFILLGIGNTMVQVSLNPLMMFVSPPAKYAGFLSLSQFIKSICDLLGPLILTAFFIHTGNWKLIFLVYGIGSVVSLLWLYFTQIDETSQTQIHATFKTSFRLLFSNGFVVIMVLGIFLVVGLDVGMNIGIPGYMMDKFHLSRETATNVISVYFFAKMLGTLIGSVLLIKLKIKQFFIGTTILSLIALAGMYFSPSQILVNKLFTIVNLNFSFYGNLQPLFVYCMIFIVSLGASNVFAIIFSITVQRMPDRSNELSGLMIMAVCGGAVIPPAMGIVVDSIGTNGNILILALCALYLFTLALLTARKPKTTN